MYDEKVEAQRLIKEFQNHEIRDYQVIYKRGAPRVEILTWGNKDGSSIHRVDYMLRNGSLAVYGDLFEATYVWHNDQLRLRTIAGFGLGYFHQKCHASNKGRLPHDWDREEAEKEIRSQVRNGVKEGSIPVDYYKKTEDAKENLRDCLSACHDENGMTAFLYNSTDPGLAFKDVDWWEWLPKCGHIIPWEIHAHLIGLKMAFGKI